MFYETIMWCLKKMKFLYTMWYDCAYMFFFFIFGFFLILIFLFFLCYFAWFNSNLWPKKQKMYFGLQPLDPMKLFLCTCCLSFPYAIVIWIMHFHTNVLVHLPFITLFKMKTTIQKKEKKIGTQKEFSNFKNLEKKKKRIG